MLLRTGTVAPPPPLDRPPAWVRRVHSKQSHSHRSFVNFNKTCEPSREVPVAPKPARTPARGQTALGGRIRVDGPPGKHHGKWTPQRR